MNRKRFTLDTLDNSTIVRAIRQGLVMTMPLLMIGSFALVLRHFPLTAYQRFLEGFAGGALIRFFVGVNEATFGVLSLAICIGVSVSYARQKTNRMGYIVGALFCSLSTYSIFLGLFSGDFSMSSLGAQGMFTALFSAIAASALFCRLMESRAFPFRFYTVGADSDFNDVVSVILPAAITLSATYLFNRILGMAFGVTGLETLFHRSVNAMFESIGSNTARTVLFVVMTCVFWFFGVHGTNVLESVAQGIFYSDAEIAMQGILTKSFMDVFVFMGGCGATISLLVAILWAGKQKNTRGLAKMALLPMLFNINELMVFGLPIVFNATFLIPFILVPVVFCFTSYGAISLGLVPPPDNPISWVTPLLAGGYLSTGSIAGLLLQAFNIALGAVIYRWFLLRYERRGHERMLQDLDSLIGLMKASEQNGAELTLLELKGSEGAVAKMLAEDMKHILKTRESLVLYYQPQYNSDDECIGAEALLRWNHPRCGMIYPPLLFGIAQETGQLDALERIIFEIAVRDIRAFQQHGICPAKISVNATSASLRDKDFTDFLAALLREFPEMENVLCIELTEQMSFLLGDAVEARLKDIKALGISFAVDDFAMGHTSVKYLQSNLFDLVKLDGSLTKSMMRNPRNREIISSIVHMSQTMGFKVLAEYVETAEQKKVLEELGCFLYQGYLYSPAVPAEKLVGLLTPQDLGALPQTP